MTPDRLYPVETPVIRRFLCDDGQIVDVVSVDDMVARRTALAHFEAHTARPRPAKKSDIHVRIVGTSIVEPETQTRMEGV